MRRGDHMRMMNQRFGRARNWFGFEDIQRRPSHLTGVERIEQSRVINQAALRRVTIRYAFLHACKFVRTDQTACFISKLCMQSDEMSPRKNS